MAAGRFRRDLYYRINVLHIELPPLRDRQADIPRLVEAFVEEVSARNGRRFAGISADAMRILCEYAWPGNVRELRNLVESMVVLSPGKEIGPDDIPEQVRSPGSSPLLPVPSPAREAERGDAGQLRPQLEFVFRTLVDLRVDMDDLRREFEAYRREHRYDEALLPGETGRVEIVSPRADLPGTGLEPLAAELGQAAEAPPLPSPDPVPGRDEPAASMADEAPDDASAAPHPPVGAPVVDQTPHDAPAAGEPPVRPPAAAEDASETAEPPSHPEPPPGSIVLQPGMTLEDIEREAILAALEEVDGSRRHAARLLGIAERTLYRKIRRYGLE